MLRLVGPLSSQAFRTYIDAVMRYKAMGVSEGQARATEAGECSSFISKLIASAF